jgi:hypothetical protein
LLRRKDRTPELFQYCLFVILALKIEERDARDRREKQKTGCRDCPRAGVETGLRLLI